MTAADEPVPALAGERAQHLRAALSGGVLTLTLDRPERRNPLTFASYADLLGIFGRLRADRDVKTVVLAGSGGNFSSGGDVLDIIGPLVAMGAADLLRFTQMTGDLVKAMRACPQPVIAAVDGVCAGAGAILAMAADIRLGTPSARVAFLFNRVGLAGADMGACALLPRIVGQGRAAELLMTGRTLPADEGERWGFFNRIVEPGQLAGEAQALAASLAAGPTFATGLTKKMLQVEWAMSVDDAIDAEAVAQALCMTTEDFARAYRAFAAKEKPVFEGKLMGAADDDFLAWPFFDPRHRTLRREAAGLAQQLAAAVDHGDIDGSCRRLVAALGRSGLLRLATVAPFGGLGERLDVRSLCLVRETLAYRSGLADFAFAMQGLGAGPITLAGSDAQRRRWLPAVAAGEAIPAFALTEPEAGSDVAALGTRAEPDGDGFRLSGRKTWISNGGIADVYVVFARSGEGPGTRGLSAFIVAADAPGFTVEARLETSAPHPLATLRLDGVRVGAEHRIGRGGDGFRIAMATLDVFRSTVGAAALGFARRALDESVARAAMRPMLGGVLGDLQLVQGALADMAVDVDLAALAVYRAAWTKDAGAQRVTREASIAKLVATEAAGRVCDAAVQMAGGEGVRAGSVVETLWREVRALRIYEGASDVQRVIIARDLLKAAKAGAAAAP